MTHQNKIAFVTGGSSGIGLAICKRFTQEGATVIFLSRDQKKIQNAQKLLGEKAKGFVCDVADTNALQKVFEEAAQEFGKIDILVANAGIYRRVHLDNVTPEDFDEMMNINFKGVYFTVQKALPHLNEHASVQLIASIAGLRGVQESSLYGSCKAAVQFLAKALSADLIERNIRVNTISPGYILTPMVEGFIEKEPNLIEMLEARIPTKRIAKPEEIAALSCFLASEEARYIVGQNITMDGGLTAIAPPRYLSNAQVAAKNN